MADDNRLGAVLEATRKAQAACRFAAASLTAAPLEISTAWQGYRRALEQRHDAAGGPWRRDGWNVILFQMSGAR